MESRVKKKHQKFHGIVQYGMTKQKTPRFETRKVTLDVMMTKPHWNRALGRHPPGLVLKEYILQRFTPRQIDMTMESQSFQTMYPPGKQHFPPGKRKIIPKSAIGRGDMLVSRRVSPIKNIYKHGDLSIAKLVFAGEYNL